MGINKNSVVLYKIQSIKLIKTCFVGVRITKSTVLFKPAFKRTSMTLVEAVFQF